MKNAVLFLVFNRPDTTAHVFEAIRAAQPPRLYLAADGPRPGRPEEVERCEQVRRIVSSVDWPCEVKTLFRDTNLGCKIAVSSAITWFFEHEEEGIILEDDCLPDPSFFCFCQEMLEKYRTDSRVAMVAGTNLSESFSPKDESYFFSRLVQIWGWATWRRAWQLYDVDMLTWPDFVERNGFENIGIHKTISDYVSKSFVRVANNEVNTWDYQWSYAVMSNSMYVAVPRVNMIKNIGLGGDATHTHDPDGTYSELNLNSISFPLSHPKFILPLLAYDMKKVSHVSGNITSRIVKKIRKKISK